MKYPLSASRRNETTAGTTMRESAQLVREIARDHCISARPFASSDRRLSALCRANADTSSTFAIAKNPSSPSTMSFDPPVKAWAMGLSPASRSAIAVDTDPKNSAPMSTPMVQPMIEPRCSRSVRPTGVMVNAAA